MLMVWLRIIRYSMVGVAVTIFIWTLVSASTTFAGSGTLPLDCILAGTMLCEDKPLLATLFLAGIVSGNYIGFGGAHS
jgi:hypothetical protein